MSSKNWSVSNRLLVIYFVVLFFTGLPALGHLIFINSEKITYVDQVLDTMLFFIAVLAMMFVSCVKVAWIESRLHADMPFLDVSFSGALATVVALFLAILFYISLRVELIHADQINIFVFIPTFVVLLILGYLSEVRLPVLMAELMAKD